MKLLRSLPVRKFALVAVVTLAPLYAVSEFRILLILIQSFIDKKAAVATTVDPQEAVKKTRKITDDELADIAVRKKANDAAAAAAAFPAVGQLSFVGVADLTNSPEGTMGLLTFQFVDPATGTPALQFPATVTYEYLDVNSELVTLDDYFPIGTSSDIASSFSVPFTIPGMRGILGNEILIRATPFDGSGAPITFDLDGENAALGLHPNLTNPVPEPSSSLLVAGALFVLFARLQRSKRN